MPMALLLLLVRARAMMLPTLLPILLYVLPMMLPTLLHQLLSTVLPTLLKVVYVDVSCFPVSPSVL